MHTTQKLRITDCDSQVGGGSDVDMDDWLRMVEAGACGAWSLPGDATCAGLARRVFRQVAVALSLDPEVADDGVMMVSELAANTLHAQREQRAAPPELWIYLRGAGPRRELVCKVFDAFRGWVRGTAPGHDPHRAAPDATSGRGLAVVHELSQGRWGYHQTRARLAGWDVGGKAVWFSVPATTAAVRPAWMPASAAATEIEKELAARGFDGKLVRAGDSATDLALLSMCDVLTVCCRRGTAWLHAPGFISDQWGYCDLVEVAEQAVEAYEALAGGSETALLADATLPCGLPPR